MDIRIKVRGHNYLIFYDGIFLIDTSLFFAAITMLLPQKMPRLASK